MESRWKASLPLCKVSRPYICVRACESSHAPAQACPRLRSVLVPMSAHGLSSFFFFFLNRFNLISDTGKTNPKSNLENTCP